MSVSNFCFDNLLCLNASKSAIVVFNNPHSYDFSNTFSINNITVPIVQKVKYLGFILDSSLKFADHLNYIISKVSSANYMLTRASSFIPKHSLLLLFNSLILSHIIYSKCILINMSKNCLKPLYKKHLHSGAIVENCLVRYVNISSFNLFYNMNYYFLVFLFKILNNDFSPQLNSILVRSNHSHFTRCRNSHLFIPRVNSEKSKKIFNYFASFLWNSLPNNIINCHDLNSFKILLSSYFSDIFLS